MDRREFCGLCAGGLVALLIGQGCSKTPVYEGEVTAGVGKFISIPNTDLVGIVKEEDFDASKLKGKFCRIYVYGEERINVVSQEKTGFIEVDRIKTEDGSQIYRRVKDNRLPGYEIPSKKLLDEDKYLSPKNFTYDNKDAWEEISTKKIILTGGFSSDLQYIEVRDEEDNKINKIKIDEMSDWIKFQLQRDFFEGRDWAPMKTLEIYATVKETVDFEQRRKTRELFSARVNHIQSQTKNN